MGSSTKSSNTGKPRHKPGTFTKGDPRINRNGQISKKRLNFNKAINELIVSEGESTQAGTIGDKTVKLKKVEWMIKGVFRAAIAGEAWAVNFIAERVEGKITQPIDAEQNILFRLVYDKKADKK